MVGAVALSGPAYRLSLERLHALAPRVRAAAERLASIWPAARQREGLRAVSRFEYHQPESLVEAIALAERYGAEASFLAGGTDLIVQIERGGMAPRHVVGLERVPGLTGIETNGRIALGARVTHRAIERAAAFAGALRGLVESAEVIGGHQVRNVGTVGGNLVNASPAADLVPCLLALDAAVTLVGPGASASCPWSASFSAPTGRPGVPTSC